MWNVAAVRYDHPIGERYVSYRRRHGGRRGGSHLDPHCCGDLEEPGDGRRLRAADLHGLPPADRWLVHPHVDASEGIPLNRRSKARGDGAPGPAARKQTKSAHQGAKRVIGRIVALVVTGIALYVVLPSLTAVFGAWPRLAKLSAVWLVAALVAEAASFVATSASSELPCEPKAGLPSWRRTHWEHRDQYSARRFGPRERRCNSMLGRPDKPDAAASGLTASSLLGVAGLLMLQFSHFRLCWVDHT